MPLINFAVYAVCIAHAQVANLDPPRHDLLFTFVFPLVVPVVVYALRWPRANRLQRGVAVGVVLGTLLFCSGMALVEGGFDGPTFDIMGSTLEDWGVGVRTPSSPAVREE